MGKETVRQLAAHGAARIYLTARSEEKYLAALADLEEQQPGPPPPDKASSSASSASDSDPPVRLPPATIARIRFLSLDLASPKSVREAAATVLADAPRLDTLVLNAGVMDAPTGCVPPGVDAENGGLEIQMGTNHVGHFLLTTLLMPLLKRTAAGEAGEVPETEGADVAKKEVVKGESTEAKKDGDSSAPGNETSPAGTSDNNNIGAAPANRAGTPADVRVIALSSLAWQMSPTDLKTLTSTQALLQHTTWARYGASKAANVMFAAELARRFGGEVAADTNADGSETKSKKGTLTAVSVHPGVIPDTQLYDRTTSANPVARVALDLVQRLGLMPSTRKGTFNQLWAATTPDLRQLENGGHYFPVGVRVHAGPFEGEAMGKAFWEWTEKAIGRLG